MTYAQRTRSAVVSAAAFSSTLVRAAHALGYHDHHGLRKRLDDEQVMVKRIEHQVAVVIVKGKPHSACVTCHGDGTFSYYRNGISERGATVPADVMQRLTPWERARVAPRLPLR